MEYEDDESLYIMASEYLSVLNNIFASNEIY